MEEGTLLTESTHQLLLPLEKRNFDRWKKRVRMMVQFEYTPKIFQTWTWDLSSQGVCIYGNGQLIFPGQRIKLTIFLPEVILIGLTGNVLWTQKSTKERRTGIIFTNTTVSTRLKITEFGSSTEKEGSS